MESHAEAGSVGWHACVDWLELEREVGAKRSSPCSHYTDTFVHISFMHRVIAGLLRFLGFLKRIVTQFPHPQIIMSSRTQSTRYPSESPLREATRRHRLLEQMPRLSLQVVLASSERRLALFEGDIAACTLPLAVYNRLGLAARLHMTAGPVGQRY